MVLFIYLFMWMKVTFNLIWNVFFIKTSFVNNIVLFAHSKVEEV